MAKYAIFRCPEPECDFEQDPLLHTYHSDCGGRVKHNLRCEDCGMQITEFYCDACGATPSASDSIV